MQTGVAEVRSETHKNRVSLSRADAVRSWRRGAELAKRLLVLAGDAAALTAAHWLAAGEVQRWLRIPRSALEPERYILFYLPFLLVVLFLFERGQSLEMRRPEKELEFVVKGVSLSFVLLVCANFVFFNGLGFSRYVLLTWYVVALSFLLVFRFALRGLYAYLWREGLARRRTLFVGSPEKISKLQEALVIQRFQGYELVGTVLTAGEVANDGLRVLGPRERWEKIASEQAVRQIVLCPAAVSADAHWLIFEILRDCLAAGIDVEIHSDLFASREFNYELDEFSGFFRFCATTGWSKKMQLLVKSVLDKLAGLLGSLITVLVLPALAFLIKIEDGGPIFYRSAYVGPDERDCYYLKFRTMRVDADQVLERDPELRRRFEAQCKLKRDPRVTRIGQFLRKYSVDEFPSFFSILRGDISLVGPRTIMQIQKEKYGPALSKLLSVKPGLTGFWQVMGRQLTTHEERVQMDMFYIDHWSIWLDLWIVARTFWKVARAEGAY